MRPRAIKGFLHAIRDQARSATKQSRSPLRMGQPPVRTHLGFRLDHEVVLFVMHFLPCPADDLRIRRVRAPGYDFHPGSKFAEHRGLLQQGIVFTDTNYGVCRLKHISKAPPSTINSRRCEFRILLGVFTSQYHDLVTQITALQH